MNREAVLNILNSLKSSTDKKKVLKDLVKLRTDLVKDKDGVILFQECNAVPFMVRFLKKPHEQILEVVLSILGNCCTNPECCKEALTNNVIVALTTILKSIPNVVIQCRACRLLGNLAKFYSGSFSNHFSTLASALSQTLDENSDIQTLFMCMRAIRLLLSERMFARHFLEGQCGYPKIVEKLGNIIKKTEIIESNEVKEMYAPPSLAGLKTKIHSEKYFEEVSRHLEGVRNDVFYKETNASLIFDTYYQMPADKASEELVQEILKCLVAASQSSLIAKMWNVIRKDTGLEIVVFFTEKTNKFRPIALKILSNLSKHSNADNVLGTSNAVLATCNLIVAEDLDVPLSQSEIHHCLIIICLLSGDACNRGKIRRSGAIVKLLNIAKTSTNPEEVSLVFYFINNFQYDSVSIKLMLHNGLIGILIDNLNKVIKEKESYSYKRKSSESENENYLTSKVRKCDQVFMFDIEYPPNSPPRSASPLSPRSPCGSRSMSPSGSFFKVATDMDSDAETYSPVCSEDEGAEDDSGGEKTLKKGDSPKDSVAIKELLDMVSKTEANFENNFDKEEDYTEKQEYVSLMPPRYAAKPAWHIIPRILVRVTTLFSTSSELCQPHTINTIIEAIRRLGFLKTYCTSLANILGQTQFFVHIIKLDVIHRLYLLTKEDKKRCKLLKDQGIAFLETLSVVAQSNYGRGELRELLKLTDQRQKRAAIAVAFIITDRTILYNILTEFGVIQILLNLILDIETEYADEAADGISAMSQQALEIQIPKSDANVFTTTEEAFESDVSDVSPHESDMTFIVHENDEEITVGYSKQLLSNVSEVFETMLNSSFREGKEGEIHFKTYTVNGLKYFLKLISFHSQKKLSSLPPPKDHTTLIEAYELSRVYMIPDLEKMLYNIVINTLDETNCQKLLEWSLKNYHAELTEIVINYYLCSDIPGNVKTKLFRETNNSSYSSEWLQIITNTVMLRASAATPVYEIVSEL